MDRGLLVVISGPSGAGKGTICNNILHNENMTRSISVTTRAPRKGEADGVDYYFRTIEQYRQMIANGEFLETASVFNNFYGTPKAPVFESINGGKDVLFEVDVMGAQSIKKIYPDAVAIFIMPPNFEVLEKRLRGRGTETDNSLKTRLSGAKKELSNYETYDYIVFNDDLETATKQVTEIINAERCKIKNNLNAIKKLLK